MRRFGIGVTRVCVVACLGACAERATGMTSDTGVGADASLDGATMDGTPGDGAAGDGSTDVRSEASTADARDAIATDVRGDASSEAGGPPEAGTADGATDASGASDGDAAPTACTPSCTSLGECLDLLPGYGVYECRGLACLVRGCSSDDECATRPGNTKCRHFSPTGSEVCTRSCTGPSDCVDGGANALYDTDNYTCHEGGCVHVGCVSDDECRSVFGDPSLRCAVSGPGRRWCARACATDSNCRGFLVHPLGPSDPLRPGSYSCVDNACVPSNCTDHTRCTAAWDSTAYCVAAPM